MDSYWSDTQAFVSGLRAVAHVYGPSEMNLPGLRRYAALGTELEPDALLVLHKGRLEQCDLRLLQALQKNGRVVFANEVFVVFAGPAVQGGRPTLPADDAHVSSFLIKVSKLIAPKKEISADQKLNPDFSHDVQAVIDELVGHLKLNGSPNINSLWLQLKEINSLKWSVKQQGYAIGREVYKQILSKPVPAEPSKTPLDSKPSTHADLESAWFPYWMAQLMTAPLPHRKLWEFAWILQNLHALGLLKEGAAGLGFGCGEEPLPSFFAARGISVTVTDLDPEIVIGMGWAETGQHTGTLEAAWKSNLVSRELFERNVSLEYVDMNAIPGKLFEQYDFCWSVCALEHLGSIENGLNFIENSLATLKPGGVALHTTELNYTETDKTVDNHSTVLFLARHFRDLSVRLEAQGHIVAPLDFDVGCLPLDNFVDVPPYSFKDFAEDVPNHNSESYRPGHLKLSVDGFPSTCFGFRVKKRAAV